jgi:hypothetical protein
VLDEAVRVLDDVSIWPAFRALFDALAYYEGASLHADVLVPWLAESGEAARSWLVSFAQRKGSPIPIASDDDLWSLYALSRVNDVLLMSFQPGTRGRAFELSLGDYVAFATAIGLQVVQEANFSPFFHEIVTVEQNPMAAAPVTLDREHWPALMLGDMMFSRAGVAVTGGRAHIRKEIAETSTMYWAFRRRNRRIYDLSVGWGSNSQWRTSFRRDYRIARSLYFNVDDAPNDLAQPSPPASPDDPPLPARLELLLHRCFITLPDPEEYCFPFNDTFRQAMP